MFHPSSAFILNLFEDFFCKGFKFHLFLIFYPKSHTLFVHISHIVKSFLRIGFDMFLMISSPFLNSKGRKDFSWIQFFSWKTVYSVHFRIVYSLLTWKTKIWFRKFWLYNCKRTASKLKCLFIVSTLCFLTEI